MPSPAVYSVFEDESVRVVASVLVTVTFVPPEIVILSVLESLPAREIFVVDSGTVKS